MTRMLHVRKVYRGIRKPYLHLMHDVMSLEGEEEEEGRPQDSNIGGAVTAIATKADPPAPMTPPQQTTSLLRAWHQRGNPFQTPGDNYPSSESPDTAASAPNDRGGGAGTGDGAGGSGGGVGLGRLPQGTDVDDEPDAVSAVALGGGGGEAGRARREDFGGGGGGNGVLDELDAEEQRCGGWVSVKLLWAWVVEAFVPKHEASFVQC